MQPVAMAVIAVRVTVDSIHRLDRLTILLLLLLLQRELGEEGGSRVLDNVRRIQHRQVLHFACRQLQRQARPQLAAVQHRLRVCAAIV